MSDQLVIPLYDVKNGGGAQAYLCDTCKAVTHTAVGMVRHLWLAHRIRQQLDLPLPTPAPTLESLAGAKQSQKGNSQ